MGLTISVSHVTHATRWTRVPHTPKANTNVSIIYTNEVTETICLMLQFTWHAFVAAPAKFPPRVRRLASFFFLDWTLPFRAKCKTQTYKKYKDQMAMSECKLCTPTTFGSCRKLWVIIWKWNYVGCKPQVSYCASHNRAMCVWLSVRYNRYSCGSSSGKWLAREDFDWIAPSHVHIFLLNKNVSHFFSLFWRIASRRISQDLANSHFS